ECSADAECPSGMVCNFIESCPSCLPNEPCPPCFRGGFCEPAAGQGCTNDADCGAGAYCSTQYCTSDPDDPTGVICVSGVCLPLSGGCNADTDCPSGQACTVSCDSTGACTGGVCR
ncbi:MAG: hypothetical protein CO108_04030, partial [Deltaproteobacteria bacterium CG_4_9_14_3_um_filter_63_12]